MSNSLNIALRQYFSVVPLRQTVRGHPVRLTACLPSHGICSTFSPISYWQPSPFCSTVSNTLAVMAPLISNGAPQTNGNSNTLTKGHARSYSAKHNLPSHFIGGNHLKAALSGRVKDFVAHNDGHTVITSVSGRQSRVHSPCLC